MIPNSPQLIPRAQILPGPSDHDAVHCKAIIHPQERKQVPRLIPLYKKADWDQLRRAMTDLADRMEPLKDSATSEKMWTLFRDTLRTAISDCNPHKQARVRESKPSISPTLHSLAHQEEGPCLQEDVEARHRGTEGPVQTAPRRSPAPAAKRAYWAYLNTTFEDADSEQATKNKRWLEPSQADAEILPDIYKVYRKDRNRHGSGVLLAVRTSLDSHEVPELQEDCEMIWVKLKLQGRETLYICTTDQLLLMKLLCHGSTPILLELQLSPTLTSSLAVTSTSPAGTGN